MHFWNDEGVSRACGWKVQEIANGISWNLSRKKELIQIYEIGATSHVFSFIILVGSDSNLR